MFRSLNNPAVSWFAVAGLVLGCTSVWAQEAATPAKRAAVPAVAAQNETRKLLGDLFRADYEQAKSAEQKVALAEKMLQVGSDTLDDPTGQYMLFQIAREIATGAPNAEVALKAVDAQGSAFEINVPETKLATVTALEKNLKFSKDRQAFLGTLDQLVNELLQAERYDLAKQATALSLDVARKVPDANAIKQSGIKLKEIETQEKLFGEVQAARKVLAMKPDDPAANLAIGRALCLIQDDWEQGLPHLAKCGDAKLKAIAAQELAQPQAADKQTDLADAWWDLSEKETGSLQSAMQQRAVAWYQTALPQLTGLAKLKVTGRIEKVGEKPVEEPKIATTGPGKAAAQPPNRVLKPTQPLVTNSLGMKLVLIPAGTFTMGAPQGEGKHVSDETQHTVTLTKPFYMDATEVTQGQWFTLMGTQPWQEKNQVRLGVNHAASYITWDDATEFCRKLSAKERKTYRLPTEAEWEYACRAGTKTMFHCDPAKTGDFMWHFSNAGSNIANAYPHEVALKQPNPAGLYDMHGNVKEYCSDWHATYPEGGATDPQGPDSGSKRVARGGSFRFYPEESRSARRFSYPPTEASSDVGFRVVYDPMVPYTTANTSKSATTPAQPTQPATSGVKPGGTAPTQPATSSSRAVPTGRGTPIARTGSAGPDKWKDFQNDLGELVDGKIRLANKGSLSSTAKVSGPVDITVVAKTSSTNIRLLAVGKSLIIWNWEVRRDELRVQWPDGSISTAKVAPLETGRWYRLRWVIEKDRFSVYTDDELVFQETRPGMTFTPNPVKVIPSHGSVVEVDSFVVLSLKE